MADGALFPAPAFIRPALGTPLAAEEPGRPSPGGWILYLAETVTVPVPGCEEGAEPCGGGCVRPKLLREFSPMERHCLEPLYQKLVAAHLMRLATAYASGQLVPPLPLLTFSQYRSTVQYSTSII